MYCNDVNNGHATVSDTKIAGTIWMYQIQNYLGGNNVRGLTHGSQVSGNVFFCPSATSSNPSGNIIPGGGASNFWGTATYTWDGSLDNGGWWDKAVNAGGLTMPTNNATNNPAGLTDVNGQLINAASPPIGSPGYRSSYGLNSWFDIRYPYGNQGKAGVGTNPNGNTKTNTFPPNYNDMRVLSNIGQPATTPLFADMVWANNDLKTTPSGCNGVVPSDYATGGSTLVPTDLNGDSQTALGRGFINRHDKAVSVGFLGGNANIVKLTELTQLDWYNAATRTALAQIWINVVNK